MSGKILVGDLDGVYVIRFMGDVRVTLTGAFDHYIDEMLADPAYASTLIDLNDAIAIDSTSLGGLARLSIRVREQQHRMPTLLCASPDILRVLRNMGFDDVFEVVGENYRGQPRMSELPVPLDISEAELRQRVIDAHKALMSMNPGNRDAFHDLVAALEAEAEVPANDSANVQRPVLKRV